MKRISSIIIDDEKSSRDNLEYMLNNFCPEVIVSGKAGSCKEGKKLLYDLNPEIVFLDINMPGQDGFEFLESLNERNFCVIIFSGDDRHGIKAVKNGADDYILKPIDENELQNAIKNIFLKLKDGKIEKNIRTDKLIVNNLNGFSVLELNDIISLSGEGSYTQIRLTNQKPILSSKVLKDYEEVLNDDFFRIHRSYIINLNHLKEYSGIDGGYAIMKDNSKIMISRRKLPEFMKKIKSININLNS
jgi:two-component system LytT family response regulator